MPTALAPTPRAAPAGTITIRAGRLGVRVHRRAVGVCLVLAWVVTAAVAVSVSVGEYPVPLADVAAAIADAGDPAHGFVVRTLRLPRALTGALAGAAFGTAGAVFQSLTRNPLASPDLIGINAGATAAAVAVIVATGAGSAPTAAAALAGGTAAAAAIYALAYRRGVSGYRLVLVGVGVDAALRAVTAYLLTRAEIFEAQRAMVWLVGSLNGRSWDHAVPAAVAVGALVPATLLLGRQLRLLELGDDTARGLGVRVERARLALVAAAVGLTAAATASVGPIAFVALAAPQIARRLTRSGGAPLTAAALVGAALVLAADLAARRAVAPTELPVGVVTGLLGAPYLLWLLARTNRTGAGR